MGAVVDTATDMVAVEGEDCAYCTFTGDTYNIEGNVDNGSAILGTETVNESYG